MSIGSLSDHPDYVKAKTTNLCVASLSIINTMIGGGILVLPKSALDMGLLMSKQNNLNSVRIAGVHGFRELACSFFVNPSSLN